MKDSTLNHPCSESTQQQKLPLSIYNINPSNNPGYWETHFSGRFKNLISNDAYQNILSQLDPISLEKIKAIELLLKKIEILGGEKNQKVLELHKEVVDIIVDLFETLSEDTKIALFSLIKNAKENQHNLNWLLNTIYSCIIKGRNRAVSKQNNSNK